MHEIGVACLLSTGTLYGGAARLLDDRWIDTRSKRTTPRATGVTYTVSSRRAAQSANGKRAHPPLDQVAALRNGPQGGVIGVLRLTAGCYACNPGAIPP